MFEEGRDIYGNIVSPKRIAIIAILLILVIIIPSIYIIDAVVHPYVQFEVLNANYVKVKNSISIPVGFNGTWIILRLVRNTGRDDIDLVLDYQSESITASLNYGNSSVRINETRSVEIQIVFIKNVTREVEIKIVGERSLQ